MATHIRERVAEKYKHQPAFLQAVTELLENVVPYLESQNADEAAFQRLERLLTPERTISFRVVWEDDAGILQHNIGYRIQFSSALGPYKGGLRFDDSVNEDILKFLGFEQIFKNSLTGLPLGAGKGGSDFNPKGKSDNEIRKFCVAFMGELARHIGENTDVPAGDIGVGEREIGYLYGAYKKITNRADGTLTGKGTGYSGSFVRTEATGYGAVYFVKEMLKNAGKELKGMHAVVSGSGNVATHVAEKLIEEGAIPLTLSDRGGYVVSLSGLTRRFIDAVKVLKSERKELSEMKLPEGYAYKTGKPWREVKADIYMPCATQNEVDRKDAEAMVEHAIVVAEGANMPSTLEAAHVFQKSKTTFGPAKAVNAGGVAVSGLEMSQNAGHTQWSEEEVDAELRKIMQRIHATCVAFGTDGDRVDYVKGANIGGFVRVFEAMNQLGW